MEHLTYKISGKVQGVFFRAYTQQKALELGIKGYVKNEDDGSVLIEAEADPDILSKFTSWCHEGSPFAKVEKVEIHKGELKNFEGFSILR
ncbi:MAG TPA: acylphosphatase [Cytophagaceae bacterium]